MESAAAAEAASAPAAAAEAASAPAVEAVNVVLHKLPDDLPPTTVVISGNPRFTADNDSAERARALRQAAAESDVDKLPALLEVRRSCSERGGAGAAMVLCITGTILGTTHALALVVGDLPTVAWWVCLVFMYTVGALALFGLVKILFGDPGVVVRSPETCFPVPDELLSLLESG